MAIGDPNCKNYSGGKKMKKCGNKLHEHTSNLNISNHAPDEPTFYRSGQ